MGDASFFDTSERKAMKLQREREAIEVIRGMLDPVTGQELHDLWYAFEDRESPEAKFAGALDQLEVQIQHNLADIRTWTPIEYDLVYTKMDRACAHDSFIAALCEAVKDDSEGKMRAAGIDVDGVKQRLGAAF